MRQNLRPRAHRLSYELYVGPIPEGLQIDHTCHNADESCKGGSSCLHRRCVNPAHLEAVTQFVNIMRGKSFSGINARKSHCPKGHPLDDANTLWTKKKGHHPYRMCRICRREWDRARGKRYYAANRAKVLASQKRRRERLAALQEPK